MYIMKCLERGGKLLLSTYMEATDILRESVRTSELLVMQISAYQILQFHFFLYKI